MSRAICVVNDVSEREYQIERGGTWDKGKGCDTFGPVGPWLVTKDEVGDVQNLAMWLDVNGERKQTGTTATMIFDVRHHRELCQRVHDAAARRHHHHRHAARRRHGHEAVPLYLKAGDIVRLGIEKLGEQQQTFVAWEKAR